MAAAQEKSVLDFIQDNLHRDISLSDLAGVAGLSRFHFTRAFKRTTGFSPYQFILSARVERAKFSLANSDESMFEISRSLGFGNQGQFAAAFRKLAGTTPSQFRRGRRLGGPEIGHRFLFQDLRPIAIHWRNPLRQAPKSAPYCHGTVAILSLGLAVRAD